MSEILKEIKKLRKEVKEVKNILTDETSRKYVQALIDNVKEEELSKEYLEHWTCDHCGEHTHEVDYDYLGNGTNHLGCELKQEDLQRKSDKIMKEVEDNMKNFDLSKSESNENSKVDMSGNKEDK